MPSNDSPIVILAGEQADGTTYRLHPASLREIRAQFPNARISPSVFVGRATQESFEEVHGSIWKQIALILIGIPINILNRKIVVRLLEGTKSYDFDVE